MKEKRPGNTAILSILLGLALLGMTGIGALFFTQQRRPYNTSQRLGNSIQDNLAETSDGKLQGIVLQTYRQYSDVPAVPKGV
jgi:hypothetical protein